MNVINDIQNLIAESRAHDEVIDATELALLAQKLHPDRTLGELISMVVEQASRKAALWPKAGPHSL